MQYLHLHYIMFCMYINTLPLATPPAHPAYSNLDFKRGIIVAGLQAGKFGNLEIIFLIIKNRSCPGFLSRFLMLSFSWPIALDLLTLISAGRLTSPPLCPVHDAAQPYFFYLVRF